MIDFRTDFLKLPAKLTGLPPPSRRAALALTPWWWSDHTQYPSYFFWFFFFFFFFPSCLFHEIYLCNSDLFCLECHGWASGGGRLSVSWCWEQLGWCCLGCRPNLPSTSKVKSTFDSFLKINISQARRSNFPSWAAVYWKVLAKQGGGDSRNAEGERLWSSGS